MARRALTVALSLTLALLLAGAAAATEGGRFIVAGAAATEGGLRPAHHSSAATEGGLRPSHHPSAATEGGRFDDEEAAPVEAVGLLQAYLRIDTTNPPGDEREAAALLAEVLQREGIEHRVLTSPGGRANLVARLDSGQPDAGALVLLHHMDVVPPGPGWTVEPFAGRVRDGYVWGRGAIDAKSLGIAHLVAFVELHRSGAALARDAVFLAVGDEEAGGHEGMGWLALAHPELLEGVGAVLNEGGANRAHRGRLIYWGIEVAQKRPLWLELTARGRGGHASTYNPASAPNRLVAALGRLVERPAEPRLTAEALAHFRAIAPYEGGAFARWVGELEGLAPGDEPPPAPLPGLETFLVDSVQVTVLEAGFLINATPEAARAQVDVRLLPDADEAAFLEEIRQTLGPGIDLEILLRAPPAEPSPTDTPLYRCLEEELAVRAPVVPVMIAGTTDSRTFRERGVPAYGFSPFALESADLRGIHGPDERLPVAAFERGVETMRRLVHACATAR